MNLHVACLTLFSCRDGSLAPAGEVDAGSVPPLPEEARRRLAVDLGLGFARGRIVAGVRRGKRRG